MHKSNLNDSMRYESKLENIQEGTIVLYEYLNTMIDSSKIPSHFMFKYANSHYFNGSLGMLWERHLLMYAKLP